MSDDTNSGVTQPSGEATKEGADPQTTAATPAGKAAGETEDAGSVFDSSLLDTVTRKYEQPTEKVQEDLLSGLNEEGKKNFQKWETRYLNGDEDDDGNLYDFTHPKMPSWIKARLEKRYSGEFTQSKTSDDVILQKVERQQLANEFSRLPADGKKKVSTDVDYYMNLGVSENKAIKEAMRKYESEQEAFKRGLSRSRRAGPPDGDPVLTKKHDELSDEAMKAGKQLGISDDDRKKYSSNNFTI